MEGKNWINYENDDAARKGEDELLLGNIGPYEDETFPPNGDSLYWNLCQPPKYGIPSNMVQWCRIGGCEIAGCEEPMTWIDGGVTIGALADNWFLGALAIISGCVEESVRKMDASIFNAQILVSDRHKARGIYTAKFFKNGTWCYLHIDDRIPCSASGHPLFGRSPNPNEVWVMILEKAYAKLHGCYEAIRCGSIIEALRDMTSFPGRLMRLEEDQISLQSLEAQLYESTKKANDTFLSLSQITWPELKRIRGHGNTLSPMGVMTTQKLCDANMGIFYKRPYAILQMQEVMAQATIEYDEKIVRMVKLWNPWGFSHWRGDWCPGHALWQTYAPIAQACPVLSCNEFWMEWKDILHHFDTVAIARRFHSENSSGEPSCPRQRGTLQPNSIPPQFCIDVPVATDVCFELSQPDIRFNGDKHPSPISLRIQQAPPGRRIQSFISDDTIHVAPYSVGRSVTCFLRLDPGSYAIVPTVLGHHSRPFLLELWTDKHITLNEDSFEDGNDESNHLLEQIADQDEQALLSSIQVPPLCHEQEPGHELHILWEQADYLIHKLSTLTTSNTDIDKRLAKAESTLLEIVTAESQRKAALMTVQQKRK